MELVSLRIVISYTAPYPKLEIRASHLLQWFSFLFSCSQSIALHVTISKISRKLPKYQKANTNRFLKISFG